jgi:hypothetical protein
MRKGAALESELPMLACATIRRVAPSTTSPHNRAVQRALSNVGSISRVVRPVVWVIWVTTLWLGSTRHGLAQACHLGDLRPEAAVGPVRVSLLTVAASYRNRIYAGEYQGVLVAASYDHPWFSAEAAFGGYRIVRNGLRDYGVSDVALDARGTVARFGDDMALGLELAATLPTGDPGRGLGMGHVMLMPGAFFQLQKSGLRLMLQLAYGRAVVPGEGHEHASPTGPLVNPMNRSEIEHAATLSYQFHAPLFAAARLFGAVPVFYNAGEAREALGLALGAGLSRWQLSAELQLPLVGQPFVVRTQLSAALSF